MKKKQTISPFDKELMEVIQPQGGITFKDESYIHTGTSYEACIRIIEYPSLLSEHWLANICNIPNTIATLDISTEDIIEVKKNINKSMIEQDSRYRSATEYGEQHNAQKRFMELEKMLDEIQSYGEVIKVLQSRIFVSEWTRANLEEKVANIIATLDSNGYKCAVFLNETRSEWKSMYQDYTEQQKTNPYDIYGQPLQSDILAGGNPFHFSSLEDTYGTFLGDTPCGGNVIFDEFTKTKTRLYYNSLCVGTMGSGKSTLLKKRFEDRAIRGDFVRTFDITGEFTTLTKMYGGKIIKLDGSNGMLNPLEILRAGENDNSNFTRHITKVTTMYRFLRPDVPQNEVTEFQNVIRDVYDEFELTPGYRQAITGLPSKKYPIFSDVLQFVIKRMETLADGKYNEVELKVAEANILILENIRKILEYIVTTYGAIFNGYTSIDNILDEQIVTFDISELKEMDDKVFDAQIFNMVSLCWDNCVTNGTYMKKKYENGEITFEEVVRFLILIDESHRWINTQKEQALEMITIYLREARKFFGGIMLASQSIRDYVPEGSDSNALNKLKTVFELTQYKFIFHQDSNVLGLIDTIFNNVLTETQRNRIPKLEQGETILCISSDRNLEFKVALSKEENRIFSGGV